METAASSQPTLTSVRLLSVLLPEEEPRSIKINQRLIQLAQESIPIIALNGQLRLELRGRCSRTPGFLIDPSPDWCANSIEVYRISPSELSRASRELLDIECVNLDRAEGFFTAELLCRWRQETTFETRSAYRVIAGSFVAVDHLLVVHSLSALPDLAEYTKFLFAQLPPGPEAEQINTLQRWPYASRLKEAFANSIVKKAWIYLNFDQEEQRWRVDLCFRGIWPTVAEWQLPAAEVLQAAVVSRWDVRNGALKKVVRELQVEPGVIVLSYCCSGALHPTWKARTPDFQALDSFGDAILEAATLGQLDPR